MRASLPLRVLAFGIVCAGLAWPALAQTEDRKDTTGYNAIIDNIDLLVDTYARTLARKYDLTGEQDEYTKFLLRERAYQFLDQHENDLRGLIDRLFDVRTGGEMTQQELVEWGQRFTPLYQEAKKLIIEGNDEWREILTPEQQKIHDEDLKLMYQSFETTEEQLGRIASGEMTVEEFRSPQRGHRASRSRTTRPPARREPQPPPEEPDVVRLGPEDQPPDMPQVTPRGSKLPARPADRVAEQEGTRTVQPEPDKPRPRVQKGLEQPDYTGRESRRGPDADKPDAGTEGGEEFESAWEKYVREFIAKYKLNDEQTQKANAVLEDCQAQAKRYTIGRREQIEKVDKLIEELKQSQDKNKSKELSELDAQRAKLIEPIERIFDEQLKPRLERLPTRAQRRAAEAAAKQKPTEQKRKNPLRRTPKPADKKND
jgi:hypothetical protein